MTNVEDFLFESVSKRISILNILKMFVSKRYFRTFPKIKSNYMKSTKESQIFIEF